MTLLTVINNTQDSLGLPRSSSVIGATDQNTRTLLAQANQEGKELMRRHNWEKLTTEDTFVSTATETQTGVFNSNFDRIVNETVYNRTQKRRVLGPLSSREWQNQKAVTATVLTDAFRIRGGDMLLIPIPPAGNTYAFEYVSRDWCESSGGTGQYEWTADTDVGVLDEELMKLGLIWRFKKSKELDYAEDFATYEREVNQAIMRDGGRRSLSYGGDARLNQVIGAYVPEGSWSL